MALDYSHKKGRNVMMQPKREWIESLSPGKKLTYETGEFLVSPLIADNRVFIIQQGRARIYLSGESKEMTLGYLNAGTPYVTHTRAWVQAVEPTTVETWPLKQIRALMEARPGLAIGALQEVGLLLHNAISIVEDLAFRSVEARLARYLLVELRQQGSDEIDLVGNTEIMASLLGTSRQTLSTIFNQLIRNDLLERTGRQRIRIKHADILEQIAGALSAN